MCPDNRRTRSNTAPDPLRLYRHAVQNPLAELQFLLKVDRHYRRFRRRLYGDHGTTRLREDFAGTGTVSAHWLMMNESHRALAVESDARTAEWAAEQADLLLGDRTVDLMIVHDDVMNVQRPKTDFLLALNYSLLIYHSREEMLAYFKNARKSLRRGGLFIFDLYGGPGAMICGKQSRRIKPENDPELKPFTYEWEQHSYDALTARIDCRIHFQLGPRRRIENAFCYHWRLWTLPELMELLAKAGFTRSEVWSDHYSASTRRSDGIFRPVYQIPNRKDWIAYIVNIQ